MVQCNIFDFKLDLKKSSNGAKVVYKYWTDLPCGTLVGLCFFRLYKDNADNDCMWTLFEEELTVAPKELGDFNGGHGTLYVERGDRNALEEFEDEAFGEFGTGINGRVSDEITFVLTVGARQRIKAFGKNNCNLSGSEVFESGGINIVEVEASILLPLEEELQPLRE